MKEISNGKNVDNLRKREYLRKGMLASSFLTIVFAVLDIVFNNYIFLIIALLFFVIARLPIPVFCQCVRIIYIL